MRRLIPLSRQRGFMAIVAVVFLVVITVMAAAVVTMQTSASRTAADHLQASAALFLAESGVEWAARTLSDSANAGDTCDNELEGATESINNGGSFTVLSAEYDEDTFDGPVCRLRVQGNRDSSSRVVGVNVPVGSAGAEGSIFDDEDSVWDNNSLQGFTSDAFPGDGVLRLQRNPSCAGPNSHVSTQNAGSIAQILEPGFGASDAVYFATNVDLITIASCNPGESRLRVDILHSGGTLVRCEWLMLAGTIVTPGCPPLGAPQALVDEYELVMSLGNGYASSAVESIRIEARWTGGVYAIELSDTCIGSGQICGGGASMGDDPVDEGSWDENP